MLRTELMRNGLRAVLFCLKNRRKCDFLDEK